MTRPTSPFAAPPLKRRPAQKRATAAEAAEKAYVRARDGGCVARYCVPANQKVVPAGVVRVPADVCEGPLEVDHVRASGGLGMKSPTHRSNLVCLCQWHHKLKTEYGRVWRPLLIAYLARVEVGE